MAVRSVDVPARLDFWVASALDQLLRRPSDAALAEALRRPGGEEDVTQFLSGVWLVLTVAIGLGGLFVVLRTDDDLLLGTVFALLAAIPGAMTLLRGVVDGVSTRRGRLPRRTRSSLAFLACYTVAALGLFVALAR
jgi:hypothetical protein